MKPARVLLLVLACPRFLGWLWPLLCVGTFFARDLRVIDDAVLVATWRPWLVEKGWKWSVTLAGGMVLHPQAGARVLAHERVHVRQAEDAALGGLVLALLVSLVELDAGWLLLWPGAMLLSTANYLGAVLRGGHAYRDAEHERSAYAQTDARADGTTWLEVHESRPRSW